MTAVNSGRIAPRGGYVAALCPPATVSIQQVKIPVGCGGVYTQRKVPESNGNRVQGAAAAAAIWKEKHYFEKRKAEWKTLSVILAEKKKHPFMHTSKSRTVTAAGVLTVFTSTHQTSADCI